MVVNIEGIVVIYRMVQHEFYDRYKQYSTADLINIVRERDNYQASAVLAAERSVGGREVSAVDQEEADQHFQEKETKRMAATIRVDSYKAAVADWVEPLAKPSPELQPYKWYRIFLGLLRILVCTETFIYVVRYFIDARSFGLNLEDFAPLLGRSWRSTPSSLR